MEDITTKSVKTLGPTTYSRGAGRVTIQPHFGLSRLAMLLSFMFPLCSQSHISSANEQARVPPSMPQNFSLLCSVGMGSGTRFETNRGGGARPGGSSQNGPSGTVQDKPPCQTGAPGPTLSSPDQAESSALETALDGGESIEAGRVDETRAQDWERVTAREDDDGDSSKFSSRREGQGILSVCFFLFFPSPGRPGL